MTPDQVNQFYGSLGFVIGVAFLALVAVLIASKEWWE